ncbi:dihydropteroate synthase [Paeniglutamicibacter cryotolerans]|uniref:Dihydropteroate synthase n=1 Tax=Paeniglutamicibacter cryotolerans TaxID=670079 RepID=A0A839QSJ1_9MICC|nr:dihydropteroate synthase [Paeniglutamicibacter cryotolerans]MBB2995011.1 dihydropteroate synthase [Paeniglutamicibacter cryotolerans]
MSLGAIPGTGPATNPMPVIRKVKVRTLADLPTDRTLVMGILNVTEDSFSDGGKYAKTDDAIQHGLRMFYGGADIIDVGGESTRPGAAPVDPAQEAARIVPVIATLVKAGAVVSVDTMHTSTARAALDAGAHLVNDVSGLTHEADMPALIAERGVPYVLMHRRGDATSMTTEADYADVLTEVKAELLALRECFIAAGVKPEQLILDPGLGFAKEAGHNWELLRGLQTFTELGHRVLVGTSRKRFLGSLLRVDGKDAEPTARDAATAATSALAGAAGVWCVRVHDVGSNLDAVKTATAWTTARKPVKAGA